MSKNKKDKKPIHDVNWYDDKYQSMVVFRNWMLLITLISIVGIFAMTMASYYFVPLKSVSPFVVQIDEKTGVTQVIDNQDTERFTANRMLIRHFAYKYIMARESYNFRTLEENINLVRLMSMPDVFKTYTNSILDPESPYKKFGASIERRVQLISMRAPRVNRTTGDISVVAKLAITELSSQQKPNEYTVEVEVQGRFNSKFTLTEEERFINPLGFTVTYYIASKEVYPEKS